MVLSKYFIKQNFDGNIKLKDKRILELGGGTGYLSIALSVLGIFCTYLNIIYFIIRFKCDLYRFEGSSWIDE